MSIDPIYTAEHTKPSYRLYYNWVGWPSRSHILPELNASSFADLTAAWETDGIRLLEYSNLSHQVRIITSVKPQTSPTLFTARIKGRLQYALRKQQTPVKFSRKLAMLTVGENRKATVERYIEEQTINEPLADARSNSFLRSFTVINPTVDLAAPTPTGSGRYWYNLHLVLVTRNRARIVDKETLTKLRDGCLRVAHIREHQISRLAVLFDHLHIALRGPIEQSPEQIALCYMNNLAYLLRRDALWQPSYYVGTFGNYDMGAIRQAL